MFVTIEKRYNSQTRYFENPNNLKNSKVIFLVDGRPVKCQNHVSHEFRMDTELQNSDSMKKILAISQFTPFIEIATNAIFIEDFFKIALGNNIEIQISGDNGIIAEYKLKDFETLWIKGYYNALFDESYMIKELINSIEDAKKHFENRVDEIDEKQQRLNAIEAKMRNNAQLSKISADKNVTYSQEIESYIQKTFNKKLLNIDEITIGVSTKFKLEKSIARAKVEEILVTESLLSKEELRQYKYSSLQKQNKYAPVVGAIIVIITISSILLLMYFNYSKK
jgi:hypothetical protein